jgi:hypothetical protein
MGGETSGEVGDCMTNEWKETVVLIGMCDTTADSKLRHPSSQFEHDKQAMNSLHRSVGSDIQ